MYRLKRTHENEEKTWQQVEHCFYLCITCVVFVSMAWWITWSWRIRPCVLADEATWNTCVIPSGTGIWGTSITWATRRCVAVCRHRWTEVPGSAAAWGPTWCQGWPGSCWFQKACRIDMDVRSTCTPDVVYTVRNTQEAQWLVRFTTLTVRQFSLEHPHLRRIRSVLILMNGAWIIKCSHASRPSWLCMLPIRRRVGCIGSIGLPLARMSSMGRSNAQVAYKRRFQGSCFL